MSDEPSAPKETELLQHYPLLDCYWTLFFCITGLLPLEDSGYVVNYLSAIALQRT